MGRQNDDTAPSLIFFQKIMVKKSWYLNVRKIMVKDSLEIKGIQLNTYYFLLIKRIYSVLCMNVFVLFFNKKRGQGSIVLSPTRADSAPPCQ